MKRTFIALSLFTFIAISADASQRCLALQTRGEMRRCAADELKAADAELNRVYQKFFKSIEPARQNKLRAAERAWVAYRDAHCTFQADDGAGGVEVFDHMTCKAELTQPRTEQLRHRE
jgi:uncharacterized protein YecT (DUF1311 family)